MSELKKAPVSSGTAQKELDKVEKQFEEFDANVKALTLDRMNEAPKQEHEPQTKTSNRELQKAKEVYLKPDKTISCRDKFNEKYRTDWEFAKQYVYFLAENKEIIGEMIELWTKPFAGIPAEFWKVPVNKPLWGPRYLAEQIKRASYHRLIMDESKVAENNRAGSLYGQMAVDSVVQRLDARPVSQNKSIFMGAEGF